MENKYKRLAVEMLMDYASELSNHGCNDFDLKEFLPELEDRKMFIRNYHEWNGDPEEYELMKDSDNNFDSFYDFAMASYLARELEKEL